MTKRSDCLTMNRRFCEEILPRMQLTDCSALVYSMEGSKDEDSIGQDLTAQSKVQCL